MIWFMAHPIAPDERFMLQQNLDHVVHMMRLCFEEGFGVIAPYHTHCLALDETNLEHRNIGLNLNRRILSRCNGLILTGHKVSQGMADEVQTAKRVQIPIIDCVALPDYNVRDILKIAFGLDNDPARQPGSKLRQFPGPG